MKRDSAGYEKIVAMIRTYCNDKYGMNLDDAGELKRLRTLLGDKLSLSTLQRIFLGANKKQERVNDTTLNILVEFIGYENVDDCISKSGGKNT